MTLHSAGPFTVSDEVVTGPADYLDARGYAEMHRVAGGTDLSFNEMDRAVGFDAALASWLYSDWVLWAAREDDSLTPH